MKKIQTTNIVKTLLLFVLLICINACGTINLVSEAQDDFNTAASYENSTKFNQESFELIQVNNYAIAYSKINEALKKESQLKNDGLLGTALTIKALCEWKLEKYDLAIATKGKALNELSGQPRDEVIMKAIPALIKTDQANAKLIASQKPIGTGIGIESDAYNSIKILIDGALEDYNEAIIGNSTHSIVNYIELSKTSAVVVLNRAGNLLTGQGASEVRKDIRNNYITPRLLILEKRLGDDSKVYLQYQLILGQ